MTAPLEPRLVPGVLHDKDANPIDSTFSGGLRRLAVDAAVSVTPPQPGSTITTGADTTVAPGATVPLPAPPSGTRRMTVQFVGGDGSSRVRVREVGGAPGTGIMLALLGSVSYGGADGAIAPLEVENVAGGVNVTVAIQFERT
jgi:hypothetical protein